MGTVEPQVGVAMQHRWIQTVAEEGERFGVLVQELALSATPSGADLDSTVPWIPAWRCRDLVGHLGTVHRWATAIVRAGHTEPPPPEARQGPPEHDLLDWYAAGLAELLDVLRSTPPTAPAWHMSPAAEKVAASWARRQAHELTVHRMDLEAAAGVDHARVPVDLAEDGVDEVLTVVVPRWAHTEPLAGAVAGVAVTADDTGRAWSVRVDHGAVTVSPGSTGYEDAHVSGTATQLLLHLWGRPANVSVTGDATAEALLRGR